MKNKYIFKNDKYEKELGYSIDSIMKMFDRYSNARLPYERMWKLLEAFDSGSFWDHVAKVLPSYAIRPDTNWISWVKENYVNSLYVGSYRGDVFCRELNNEQTTLAINEFLEYTFNKLKFNVIQHKVGNMAALLNFGAVEFGWCADIIDGSKDHLFSGDIEAKPINNMSLFLDPSQTEYRKGKAIFIAEEVSLVELASEPRFADRMKNYIDKVLNNSEYTSSLSAREYGKGYYGQRSRQPEDGTVRLLTCYNKHYNRETKHFRMDKIWIIEDGYVIGIQKGIKPNEFPVKILYSSEPFKDPYGVPTTKKILNNAITLNLLDAIDSTMVFKALQRGKIISRRAGINEPLFAKEGDNPNKLWVVDGDPNSVVKYVDLPNLPNDRALLKSKLEQGIMRIAGVDDVYTGTDTNSIQTTGGMDLLNQRVSGRDNSRITKLNEFILDVTEFIMKLYLDNSGNRSFPKYNDRHEIEDIKELRFEDMRKEQINFDFTCDITPNLPNNIQRRSETANIILEKQMQYNFNPPILTAEEWLKLQDFPDKYKILKRIKQDRLANDREDIESEIVNYAGLVNQGVRPDSAVDMLASERQLKRDSPGLGNTGNANSFQAKQSG